ncbi:MtrAB system histidine kinase MtrB [Microbacterium oryzae]|uniref:MtrAB system histidine kinase MtrB n=1 Tax=Microbacterium oryzae TaxID=743009 RepID=UPI0025B02948|nr:MtrAB system histidine kinase MtrB [Microbacterium oryzae]MDN3309898.1 MtrAB system histidine kinase MtrB [Microbacterium oryzae]
MSQAARPARITLRRPATWLPAIRAQWITSLRFRTTFITVAATALAIAVTCVFTALAIHNNLFSTSRDEVLGQAQRAVIAAQDVIDTAEVATDGAALQQVLFDARRELTTQAGTSYYAYFRVADEASGIAPPDFSFLLEEGDDAILSEGLRDRVRSSDDGNQWWQSVGLQIDDSGDAVPGIVVGQQLEVQNAGPYEVYLAYSLEEADRTLRFVQGILWITGIVLVLLVAAISWFVLRTVAQPILEASRTSERFAAGDFEVRLPVRGKDELAALGRSFNAMADSIEAQITELAELSQVQQRFVSDVSHELRTPLTTIRLASEMLNDRRSEFDESTARAAELLHTQVARFEQLLTDLLEISRYDAGSVQLELEPSNLAQLAEDVADSMRDVAGRHGSELRVVAPGGYSPVDVDPRRVRRVLRNLIGNAIEHGEGRPIVITIDSDAHAVAVGVRDYGLGMSPEQASRVFDRFWRADPSRKRTLGGTGLGLAIALGDAKLHGGALELWSEPGRGSHFVLTVPRVPGQSVTRSPIPVEPNGSAVEDLGVTEPIRTGEDLA